MPRRKSISGKTVARGPESVPRSRSAVEPEPEPEPETRALEAIFEGIDLDNVAPVDDVASLDDHVAAALAKKAARDGPELSWDELVAIRYVYSIAF